jgi:hypothetical protein
LISEEITKTNSVFMMKGSEAMEDGVWRTISGRRVFIKEGQSLSDAMKNSGKFKEKETNDYSDFSQSVIKQDLYHGTYADFDEFDFEKIGTNTNNVGIFGNGMYFTNDSDLAENYIRKDGNLAKDGKGSVKVVKLNIKKPFDWSKTSEEEALKLGFPKERISKGELLPITDTKQILFFTKKLKDNGYDGAVYTYKNKVKEIVAFYPEQIKIIETRTGLSGKRK